MTGLLPGSRMALPSIAAWLDHPWPFAEHNPVRIEESTEEGKYTIRAELPGFEPDKHISVTTHDGMLTIEAEREAKETSGGHSEFYYGKFSRTVPLPAGAEATKVKATYADGILEITMPLAAQPHEKQIKIHVDKA
ncbi:MULTISPECIES: Hsp20/alpha crystallin family protein [unclassified Amycolatopsis]|uniref:Hsp20/alpha crystallin family protein n=1 Tax=unclassified Amycolatopsis TaxID=2618356 RepID=UPI001C69DF67|nr:Hsp20/alpha crystallin family protein [Amycolatopsis sp. DSM 110486]QYN20300.1 Hsp20/alpha crystallin family protein [Amycolatopsis sp. DSM 110486]